MGESKQEIARVIIFKNQTGTRSKPGKNVGWKKDTGGVIIILLFQPQDSDMEKKFYKGRRGGILEKNTSLRPKEYEEGVV